MLGKNQLSILRALARIGPAHGYRICSETGIDNRNLYRLLPRLQIDGLIDLCDPPPGYDPGGPAAKFYKITKSGIDLL